MANPDDIINVLQRYPDVLNIGLVYNSLENIKDEQLSFPFPEYPLGCLRRTNGGLPSEFVVSISFQIVPSELGLRSLEMIADVVTDQSRAGMAIQIRAAARPVLIGGEIQTGTLTFYCEWFLLLPDENDFKPLETSAQYLFETLERQISTVRGEFPDHLHQSKVVGIQRWLPAWLSGGVRE